MPIRPSARVHPTAVISAEADIADEVEVGPFVVIEGRKRDISLTGAKEVEQYVKALEQVAKEAS